MEGGTLARCPGRVFSLFACFVWFLLGVGACSDSTTCLGKVEFTLHFFNTLTYEGVTYSCFAHGTVMASIPLPSEWAGPVDFHVSRQAAQDGDTLRADTLLVGRRVSIHISRGGKVKIDLPRALGGRATGDLQDRTPGDWGAAGPWSCPKSFPLKGWSDVVHPQVDPPWGFTGRWLLYEGPPN